VRKIKLKILTWTKLKVILAVHGIEQEFGFQLYPEVKNISA
jgi:hypothetical protein